MNWKHPVFWLLIGICIGIAAVGFPAGLELQRKNLAIYESIEKWRVIKREIQEMKEQLKNMPSGNFSVEVEIIPERIY